MKEKRTSHRIDTKIEIVFREAGSFTKSYMLNVSDGGIFIKTDTPLPLDSLISLRMQLPGEKEKMALEGRVVWTNARSKVFPVGMGVQFIDCAPEHKEKIAAFVADNLDDIKKRSIL